MNQQSSEIFIGDLMRALAAVDHRDPQTITTIAALLGFRLERLEAAPQPEPPAPFEAAEITPPIRLQEPPWPDRKEDKPKSPVELPPDEQLQYDLTEPDVEYIPRAKQTGAQPSLPWPAWERVSVVRPRYRSLFLAQWTRGILSEAAATWRAAGAVDLPRAVEVLARSTTPAELPRLYIPTLARGCQILVDVSARMAPFARDTWELIEALRSVVGRESVQVFYFKHCPIFGVETETDGNRIPLHAPPHATPVLLLSDLGIAAPPLSLHRATVEDWLSWVRRLRISASPLLALVPYHRRRWPRRLSNVMTIIKWDHDTTAAIVRRAKEKH